MQPLFPYLFSTFRCIFSSPLPPVPVNDAKQRPSTLEAVLCRLGRSDSDGNLDDDIFYTRLEGEPPPPIPQRESRPRSIGYGTVAATTTPPRPTHQRSLSKPLSPKLPLRNSLSTPTDSTEQANMRSSWSEPSNEPAPPLPPRGTIKLFLKLFYYLRNNNRINALLQLRIKEMV